MAEILALIPARGGSKSIPRKNLLPLAGRPLIVHSIEQARASRLVSRVIVTTDDAEIAAVAKAAGAEVPFLRPAELARDDSLDIEFHRHALDWLGAQERYRPDAVVNLRPTNPTRRPATIDRAIETFLAHPEADSLRSVSLAEQTPYKMWLIGADGCLAPVAALPGTTEPYNLPRQRLPLVYWQNGYVDIAWTRTVMEKQSTTGTRILPFVIEERSVDIDYPDEVADAERAIAEGDAEANGSAGKRHPS
ncbi:MAG TPA: acylneuraminate cytidylyltransferase family protein [Alphaproteobacteria bacterium]|nr:acylneuraminate cytidylyltransferase family protein [Alphaproteobacteria bacterium]